MKGQSIFLVNATHKTKTWWMFLSVLVLVFVPFLIVWLLCGEFNLLNSDWLIAKNASVWHGIVEGEKIDELANRYYIYFSAGGVDALRAELLNWVGQNASINAYRTFFNPILLAPLLGLFAWAIIYPIIFNAIKVSGLDVLPFSVGVGSFMFSLIISGLIDQWGQDLLAVYWLTRIVIAIAITFFFFLLTNLIVNKFLSGRPYATDIYFGYKKIDQANAVAKQQLKENIESYKKQGNNDQTYVEVEEGK